MMMMMLMLLLLLLIMMMILAAIRAPSRTTHRPAIDSVLFNRVAGTFRAAHYGCFLAWCKTLRAIFFILSSSGVNCTCHVIFAQQRRYMYQGCANRLMHYWKTPPATK